MRLTHLRLTELVKELEEAGTLKISTLWECRTSFGELLEGRRLEPPHQIICLSKQPQITSLLPNP